MSLDWNIEKVEDWEALSDDPKEQKITDTLVWLTLGIGMSSITAANWQDFYARVSMWQAANDSYITLVNPTTDSLYRRRITPADIERRIGFCTNAGSLSWAKFKSKLVKILEQDAIAALHRHNDTEAA